MPRPPRILIVDDNERIHDDFRSVLIPAKVDTTLLDLEASIFGEEPASPVHRIEVRPDFALQGSQAVRMLNESMRGGDRYKLAFVDIRMPPGMDGLETVRALWEVDRDLQIVLCTAFSDYSWSEMVEELEHPERFLLLKKPFEADEVLQLVTCLCSKWNIIQSVRCHMDRLQREVYARTQELVHANKSLQKEMRDRQAMELELRHAQKLEAVGQLAAGVAHEINTPIQFIGDSVHFLREAFDDLSGVLDHHRSLLEKAGRPDLVDLAADAEEEADLEYLDENVGPAFERTLDGVQRVGTIVKAMKAFAHPTQDVPTEADLNRAIRDTLEVARHEYKYAAQVHTDLADLPQVVCHIGDLNQVFLNLIVNAAHAIAEQQSEGDPLGSITVSSTVLNQMVEVCIADTGSGIPEHVQERIFEPFFTTKEVGRGTGQGLAIAHSIVVDKHGGTLTFDTVPGIGTTFYVRLPLQKAQASAA